MKKHFILMIALVLNSPLYASGLQKNIKTQKANQKKIDKNERMYTEALNQYFKLTRNIALTKAYVAWLERQEDKLRDQIAVVKQNNEELEDLEKESISLIAGSSNNQDVEPYVVLAEILDQQNERLIAAQKIQVETKMIATEDGELEAEVVSISELAVYAINSHQAKAYVKDGLQWKVLSGDAANTLLHSNSDLTNQQLNNFVKLPI